MLSGGVMAGGANQRHRLGVLPGLPGSSATSANNLVETAGLSPSHNKQLVPIGSKHTTTWNGANSEYRSNGRDVFTASQLQNFVNRVAVIEEANKALLEEVYRLQTSVRGAELAKKGTKTEERKLQHELMQTIRASNDVISELTSRMRRAEEKLHIDKETRKSMMAQTKQFEQALVYTQQEYGTVRDKQKTQIAELRHQLDEMTRRYDRSERTSTTLIDEFRQIKSKLEIQAMDFTHLQAELRQGSKRLEEDTKQALLETRFQKDNNSQAEQNSLQTRQFFEVRVNELRDIITDLRNRVGRAESEAHAQSQQIGVKFSELQSSINDQSHKRHEDIQTIKRQRQEEGHVEENERMKLQGRIKEAVDEMSGRLLSKEVRLREEALQKFGEVERIVQKEQNTRAQFEKQIREDNETRWILQQKLLQDEMRAAKESRRAETVKQDANNKRTEDSLHLLDRKLQKEKKGLEKVLLAEIKKRESQSTNVISQIDSVQEQLRVALSTLQQAIGGVQFQVTRDKDQFSNEIKTKLGDEHVRVGRAIADADSRLTALSARITQQDETYDVRINEMSSALRDKQTELVSEFQDWRENTNRDIANLQDILKEVPQELRETQERVTRLKDDSDTHAEMENEARQRDAEVTESKIRLLAQRCDTVDAISSEDHIRVDDLQQRLAISQGTLNQLMRTITEVRNSHNVRLNSETKMRLEESSAIKRELARLRMEIQPLLWQQATGSRQFVKKETHAINEWGIYQCARWYDIKMRWLRLLQRARRRRGQQHAINEQPRTPSPGLEDEYPTHIPSPGQTTPGSHGRRDAWRTNPNSPTVSDQLPPGSQESRAAIPYDDSAFDLHAGGQRTSESPNSVRLEDDDEDDDEADPAAWYNQDTVPIGSASESQDDGGGNDHKQPGLTQRIDTPRRPSVLGSEADESQPVTPTRSVAGSQQGVLRQSNSKRVPSQATNPNQRASSANKSNPQTPTNRAAKNSRNGSRTQSQEGQQIPNPPN